MSKAELQQTDNRAEGISRSHWMIQLGKNQRHVSWKIDGLAEVKVLWSKRAYILSCLTLGISRIVLPSGSVQATAVQHDQTAACVPARRGRQTHI